MTLSGSAGVAFFFFQAEDGIRDTSVTGVQTCALPIYARRIDRRALDDRREHRSLGECHVARRSEERRVGKEGRPLGAPQHQKNKVWFLRFDAEPEWEVGRAACSAEDV